MLAYDHVADVYANADSAQGGAVPATEEPPRHPTREDRVDSLSGGCGRHDASALGRTNVLDLKQMLVLQAS